MAIARKVKIQAWNIWSPVFQHSNQTTIFDEWTGVSLGDIGDARTSRRRFHHQLTVVQRQHTWYIERQFLSLFTELPAITFAAGKALPDASMLEIGRAPV